MINLPAEELAWSPPGANRSSWSAELQAEIFRREACGVTGRRHSGGRNTGSSIQTANLRAGARDGYEINERCRIPIQSREEYTVAH